jgi:chromosome segregation ATPase
MIPAILVTLLAGIAAYLLGQQSSRRMADAATAARTQAELQAAGISARAQSAEQQRDQALGQLHQAQVQIIDLQGHKSRLEAELVASDAQVAQERELLAKTRAELTDTFKALAGDALNASTGQFLK